MGVKGLHSYVEGKLPHAAHRTTLEALASTAFARGAAATIVVDGMALIRKLYTPCAPPPAAEPKDVARLARLVPL